MIPPYTEAPATAKVARPGQNICAAVPAAPPGLRPAVAWCARAPFAPMEAKGPALTYEEKGLALTNEEKADFQGRGGGLGQRAERLSATCGRPACEWAASILASDAQPARPRKRRSSAVVGVRRGVMTTPSFREPVMLGRVGRLVTSVSVGQNYFSGIPVSFG